jgi:hypothetical protein
MTTSVVVGLRVDEHETMVLQSVLDDRIAADSMRVRTAGMYAHRPLK